MHNCNRILAIETGGCPHAAIREDISANLGACETLTARHETDIILVESGGGTLSSRLDPYFLDPVPIFPCYFLAALYSTILPITYLVGL